ncbi:ORF6N domain protein [compost metagenome]
MHKGQRILTTAQLSESFGTDTKILSKNFERNESRYKEGKHFFVIKGEELREFKASRQFDDNLKFASVLYLWTEKGAWLHAKSLNTDKAWEAYELLVDEYYRIQELAATVASYAIDDPIARAERWIEEQKERQKLEADKKLLEGEIEHKEAVIVGLVDDIDLATKRQILNRVVRRGGSQYQERWRELYKQFEMKYHLNLSVRLERYNSQNKPKIKNKIDYIDKVMGKVPELYEIAAKIYENDVKELAEEIYGLNARGGALLE